MNVGGGNLLAANQTAVGQGMYVITTDFDAPQQRKKQASTGTEETLRKENALLREQVQDLETTVGINKEIIKNLLESSAGSGPQTLQQVLQAMQRENSLLQQQVARLLQPRSETPQGQPRQATPLEKERVQTLEKQLAEMKAILLIKEQQSQQKELAYNEVLQLCARYSKNDKELMSKLRELKFKHSDGVSAGGGGAAREEED